MRRHQCLYSPTPRSPALGAFVMSEVAVATLRITDDTTRAELEAMCRVTMAEIAAMPRRGFDTERRRARAVSVLDGLIDEWAEMSR